VRYNEYIPVNENNKFFYQTEKALFYKEKKDIITSPNSIKYT